MALAVATSTTPTETVCSGPGLSWRFTTRWALHKWNRNFARDHRKLLVVDGSTAFVGGTGLADEFYTVTDGMPPWHELMLQFEGPVVADWERLFARVWRWCTAEQLELGPVSPPLSLLSDADADAPRADAPMADASISDQFKADALMFKADALMKVSTCEGPRQQEIKINFRRRINGAEQRVWLVTAYFFALLVDTGGRCAEPPSVASMCACYCPVGYRITPVSTMPRGATITVC